MALGPALFVLAGGIVLMLVPAAVGYRAVRVALSDPVHTLRHA